MTATQSSDAPRNDVSLVNYLKKIPPYLIKTYPLFKDMGRAMYSKSMEHLWFLSEELVVLSLFSNKLNEVQKNTCRKAMLAHYTDHIENIKGKLITPDLRNIQVLNISTLFGKESWRLLRLSGIQGKSFLDKPASSWDSYKEYKELKEIVSNFVAVNDVAERTVLLAKTFQNKLTKKKNVKDALVNIIPELRKICESQRKKDLFKDIKAYLRDRYNHE